jgi:hypothetical protein
MSSAHYAAQLRAVLADQSKVNRELSIIDAMVAQATRGIVARCRMAAPKESPEAALMRRLDTCLYGGY